MPQSGVDKIPPGPKLDALTAEKVFGWRKVHKRQGALSGCVRNFMQPPDKIQVASGEGVQIKNFVAALSSI
jgi:hypothetical protein